jgi:hypothetical protein
MKSIKHNVLLITAWKQNLTGHKHPYQFGRRVNRHLFHPVSESNRTWLAWQAAGQFL